MSPVVFTKRWTLNRDSDHGLYQATKTQKEL